MLLSIHVTPNSTLVRPQSYYLARFLLKTALKSKKLERGREACVPSAHPLRSANVLHRYIFSLRKRAVETESTELQELTLPVREILRSATAIIFYLPIHRMKLYQMPNSLIWLQEFHGITYKHWR